MIVSSRNASTTALPKIICTPDCNELRPGCSFDLICSLKSYFRSCGGGQFCALSAGFSLCGRASKNNRKTNKQSGDHIGFHLVNWRNRRRKRILGGCFPRLQLMLLGVSCGVSAMLFWIFTLSRRVFVRPTRNAGKLNAGC